MPRPKARQTKPYERQYAGIDPGKTGGIAIVAADGSCIYAAPMPADEYDLWRVIGNWAQDNVCVVIEKVHSTPQMGVASSFTFGFGYGLLRMALVASAVVFDDVTPQKWQAGLGVPKRKAKEPKPAFKQRLRVAAQQRFPTLPIWGTKGTKSEQLAIADALLIAEYCRRIHLGAL